MTYKRPRKGDGDNFVGQDGGEDDERGCNRLLAPFGKDTILTIEGNARFARGGYGELSISLQSRCQSQPSSSNENSSSYSFVAVKTIYNAIANGGSGDGRFGDFGRLSSTSSSSRQQDQQLLPEVANELLALRLLQPHSNIAPLVAMYIGGNQERSLSLAFRYCPIDLREVLEVRRRTFRQPLAFRFQRRIFRDVFQGLSHCHDTGILHRDLKPGNLLVSSEGMIQLCDFGLAKPFYANTEEEEDTADQIAVNNDKGLCTLYYRPPEVLLGGPSEHPSVDTWSAGVVLAELILGRPLWPGRNVIDQLSLVFSSLGTPDQTTWPTVGKLPDYGKLNFGTKMPKRWERILPRAKESSMLLDFVSKLLKLDPKQRFAAHSALTHEWLKENANVASHRELRDELILPTGLQIPPLLFPEDRALIGKLGLRMTESRKKIFSPSKEECGNYWIGPNLSPLDLRD